MNARLFSLALLLGACSTSPPFEDTPGASPAPFRPTLFTNGGFEADAAGALPSGWTVTAGRNSLGIAQVPPSSIADLRLSAGGNLWTYVRGGAPESQVDPQVTAAGSLRFPRYGERAVVLNDPGASNNANTMLQTMTIASGDIDPADGKAHVRFVAAAVMNSSAHSAESQPYFYIEARNVTKGVVLMRDFNYGGQPGVPWKTQGGYVYKDWQLIDVTADAGRLDVGDSVALEIVAAGCSGGGHGLKLYVDGVGPTIDGLFATATAPAVTRPDRDITYAVRYKNGGRSAVQNAVIELSTPPQTTFVSLAAPGLTCTAPAPGTAGLVRCTAGALAVDAGGTFDLVVHVAAGATDRVTIGDYFVVADAVSPLYGTKVETLVSVVLPTTAAAAAGGSQSAVVHSAFASPLSVVVRDQFGDPYEGATVSFAAEGAGPAAATLGSGVAVTDAQGRASVSALANDVSGSYQVTARVAGVAQPVIFSLVNQAGPPASVTPLSSATPQSVQVNTALAAPLGVLVRDRFGNPVSGVTVDFAPPAQGASLVLATAQAVTDARGQAQVTAIAGLAAGNYLVLASVAAVAEPARFDLVNQPGPPGQIEALTAAQEAVVASRFAQTLRVRVTDSFGNRVPPQLVRFVAPAQAGGPLLAASGAMTDADGLAAVAVTAGTALGRFEISASVTGVSRPAVFPLSHTAGAPASIRGSATAQCATDDDRDFPAPLLVTVRDAYDNPVAGVPVRFATDDLYLHLSDNSVITDALGRAKIKVSNNDVLKRTSRPPVNGVLPLSVVASADGVARPHRFALELLASGTAVTPVTVVSGSNQAAHVGQSFALPLRVRAPGALRVEFTAPRGGASAVLPSSAVTVDPVTGEASLSVRANGIAGTYSVQVLATQDQCHGIPALREFVLTNLPGEAATVQVDDAQASPQAATVGASFSRPLRVVVRDAQGNPVPGQEVRFVAPESGARAELLVSRVLTDERGRASVAAVAGAQAGRYAISAVVAGTDQPATFLLSNAVGPTLHILAQAGSSQAQQVLRDYAEPLSVVVRDASGAPRAGVTLTFTVRAMTAGRQAVTLGSALATTDAEGRASVAARANLAMGPVLVTAAAEDAAVPAPFVLHNQPIPTQLTLRAVPGRTAEGQPVARLTAEVTMAAGAATGLSVVLPLSVLDGYGRWPVADLAVRADGQGVLRAEQEIGGIPGAHRYQAVLLPSAGETEETDRGLDSFAPSVSEVVTVELPAAVPQVTPVYKDQGCSCTVAGGGGSSPLPALLGVALIAGVLRRRSRRHG